MYGFSLPKGHQVTDCRFQRRILVWRLCILNFHFNPRVFLSPECSFHNAAMTTAFMRLDKKTMGRPVAVGLSVLSFLSFLPPSVPSWMPFIISIQLQVKTCMLKVVMGALVAPRWAIKQCQCLHGKVNTTHRFCHDIESILLHPSRCGH